uniref:Uncharacterized protein n=1 Tax=Lophocladia kuetzingii TaxID=675577 RepID=A0A1Z1MNL9_9FLOR|nr:hypothetical protein [Lophocladia kuetzingii]ARW67693.1 hypothetical protein [Lophocladia kuetzingii]
MIEGIGVSYGLLFIVEVAEIKMTGTTISKSRKESKQITDKRTI